jgi:hypothetical protein
MKAHSMCFSKIARETLMLSTLVLAGTYTSASEAAQGCGYGMHRSYYSGCIANHPGAYARPAPYHAGCWRNKWGKLRCY